MNSTNTNRRLHLESGAANRSQSLSHVQIDGLPPPAHQLKPSLNKFGRSVAKLDVLLLETEAATNCHVPTMFLRAQRASIVHDKVCWGDIRFAGLHMQSHNGIVRKACQKEATQLSAVLVFRMESTWL